MQPLESDEAFSWKAATTIMVLVAILTVTLSILGLNPFTLIFDGLIVYLPTAILVGVLLFGIRRKPASAPI